MCERLMRAQTGGNSSSLLRRVWKAPKAHAREFSIRRLRGESFSRRAAFHRFPPPAKHPNSRAK